LVAAVKQGLISESEIDQALKRLFAARFRLGMFDPPEMVPYAKIPFSENDSAGHRQMALEAARESMVLLKNDNHTLPLKKDLKSIAVIGPNADSVQVLLGNYNGQPSRATTPLAGIRAKVSPQTKVLYAAGASLTDVSVVPVPASMLRAPSGEAGLKAEFFGNRNLEGTPILTRIDKEVNFDWGTGSPAPGVVPVDDFSARWTGKLAPAVAGKYRFGAIADDGVRIYLDGKLLAEDWTQHAPTTVTAEVTLEAGRTYDLKMEYYEGKIGAVAKLAWQPPTTNTQSRYDEAVNIAKQADVVVLALGLSAQLEGEEMTVREPGFLGGDRTDIGLPARQQKLLEAVAATGKPIVLVLLNGSALAVNWANEHVPAIVEAWYPGEEGGAALADVLFGDYNPAGRLPVTFYKSVDQLPPFNDYRMQGRTYRYFKGEPLYPFGFGLSYSKFKYDNLRLSSTKVKTGDGLTVTADVQNVGARDGDEVAQLYISRLGASAPAPIRSLGGIDRIFLKAGEKRTVSFNVTAEQLSVIDNKGRRIVEPGEFTFSVGGKQPGFKGYLDAATTGIVSGRFVVTGKPAELSQK
jgi:beta-glucosidase